jgi:MFS family permease
VSKPDGQAGPYAYYVLIILVLVNTVNFIDRQAISVLAGSFQAEFGISNTQLGTVMGLAFTVFYAFLGFPIARLADRWSRRWLLAGVLAIWSGMTALCGAAGSAVQLFLFRVGVGVGEAGAGPASHSLIGDYFLKKDRPGAIGVFSTGVSLGTFLGITGGALLVGGFSWHPEWLPLVDWDFQGLGWRWTFVALGAPGLVLAILVLLTVREPVRGGLDDPADAAALRVGEDIKILEGVGRLWAIPTFRFMSVSAALSALCGYGMNLWTPLFLTRIHELQPADYAIPLGVAQGLGGALGAGLGGFITSRAAQRDAGAFLTLPGLTMVGFAIALGVAVWTPSLRIVYPAVFVASFMQIYLMGPFFGLTQRLAPLRGRAVATAFIFFILSLTGLGIGPTYVGAMNDYFSENYGQAEGLRLALTTLVGISVVAGAIAMFGRGWVAKDLAGLDRVQGVAPVLSFKGRTRRLGFLGYALLGPLAGAVAWFVAKSFASLFASAEAQATQLAAAVPIALGVIVWLGVFIPAAARRLHDLGWSGWLALLLFVPGVNVVALLMLLLAPGKAEANAHGPRRAGQGREAAGPAVTAPTAGG